MSSRFIKGDRQTVRVLRQYWKSSKNVQRVIVISGSLREARSKESEEIGRAWLRLLISQAFKFFLSSSLTQPGNFAFKYSSMLPEQAIFFFHESPPPPPPPCVQYPPEMNMNFKLMGKLATLHTCNFPIFVRD